MKKPESVISYCCRLKLARELDVDPGDLRYDGVMYGPDCTLYLFTVQQFGHACYGSTKSVRVPI